MLWQSAYRAEEHARELADRHYNRQSVGSAQFVPPGRCAVFYARTAGGEAFWVTSWPFPEYVKHEWAGAWICSAFRNEGAGLASDLIRQALAATRYELGEPPPLGLVTFVDPGKVRPTMVRGRTVYGWSFLRAGGVVVGRTKGDLIAIQFLPEVIPPAEPPLGTLADLFA